MLSFSPVPTATHRNLGCQGFQVIAVTWPWRHTLRKRVFASPIIFELGIGDCIADAPRHIAVVLELNVHRPCVDSSSPKNRLDGLLANRNALDVEPCPARALTAIAVRGGRRYIYIYHWGRWRACDQIGRRYILRLRASPWFLHERLLQAARCFDVSPPTGILDGAVDEIDEDPTGLWQPRVVGAIVCAA